MRLTPFSPFCSIHSNHSTTRPLARRFWVRLSSIFARKLICLAVVFSLVMLPAPGLAYEGRLLSSLTVDVTAGSVRVVSWLFNMVFGSQEAPPDTLVDRVAQVRTIRLSPSRHVAYSGESLTSRQSEETSPARLCKVCFSTTGNPPTGYRFRSTIRAARGS